MYLLRDHTALLDVIGECILTDSPEGVVTYLQTSSNAIILRKILKHKISLTVKSVVKSKLSICGTRLNVLVLH